MAFLDLQHANLNGVTEGINKFASGLAQMHIPTWLSAFVVYGIIISAVIFLILKYRGQSKVDVFLQTAAGPRVFQNYIKKKVEKDGRLTWWLVKKINGKKYKIPDYTNDDLFVFGSRGKSKAYCYIDGHDNVHMMAFGYDDKQKIPYLSPDIQRDQKVWYANEVQRDHENYRTRKWWETLAPYMTIAVTGVVIVIMMYVGRTGA